MESQPGCFHLNLPGVGQVWKWMARSRNEDGLCCSLPAHARNTIGMPREWHLSVRPGLLSVPEAHRVSGDSGYPFQVVLFNSNIPFCLWLLLKYCKLRNLDTDCSQFSIETGLRIVSLSAKVSQPTNEGAGLLSTSGPAYFYHILRSVDHEEWPMITAWTLLNLRNDVILNTLLGQNVEENLWESSLRTQEFLVGSLFSCPS